MVEKICWEKLRLSTRSNSTEDTPVDEDIGKQLLCRFATNG